MNTVMNLRVLKNVRNFLKSGATSSFSGTPSMEFVPVDGAVSAVVLQCGIQDRSVYVNLAMFVIHMFCLVYGTKRL